MLKTPLCKLWRYSFVEKSAAIAGRFISFVELIQLKVLLKFLLLNRGSGAHEFLRFVGEFTLFTILV